MHFLEHNGDIKITQQRMNLRDRYLRESEKFEKFTVLGIPELSVDTITSSRIPIFSIAEKCKPEAGT